MKNYSIIQKQNLIITSVKNGEKPLHSFIQELNDAIINDTEYREGMNMIADLSVSSFSGDTFYGNDFDMKVSIKIRIDNLVEILPDRKETIDKFNIFHLFKRRNKGYYKTRDFATSLEQAFEKLGISENREYLSKVLAGLS